MIEVLIIIPVVILMAIYIYGLFSETNIDFTDEVEKIDES